MFEVNFLIISEEKIIQKIVEKIFTKCKVKLASSKIELTAFKNRIKVGYPGKCGENSKTENLDIAFVKNRLSS